MGTIKDPVCNVYWKYCMIYLYIFDNAFDICRSLVQLLLVSSQVFSEVGRIQQAIGKLQRE